MRAHSPIVLVLITLVLGLSVTMIGCKSRPCEAVAVHASWANLTLPLTSDGMVCSSSESGSMIHHTQGTPPELLERYVTALQVAGWQQYNGGGQDDESNIFLTQDGVILQVNAYDYEGVGVALSRLP